MAIKVNQIEKLGRSVTLCNCITQYKNEIVQDRISCSLGDSKVQYNQKVIRRIIFNKDTVSFQMSTKAAGVVAIIFSVCSLLGVMMFIPILWQKMSTIQSKLRMDMDEFNVMTEDAWKEIMVVRHDKPKARPARQATGICRKIKRLF